MPRLDCAAAQQDFVFPLGNAADDDARILIVDDVARRAYEPRQRVAFGHSQLNRGTAVATKLQDVIDSFANGFLLYGNRMAFKIAERLASIHARIHARVFVTFSARSPCY